MIDSIDVALNTSDVIERLAREWPPIAYRFLVPLGTRLIGSKETLCSEAVVEIAEIHSAGHDVVPRIEWIITEPEPRSIFQPGRRHELHGPHGACARGGRFAVRDRATGALRLDDGLNPREGNARSMGRFTNGGLPRRHAAEDPAVGGENIATPEAENTGEQPGGDEQMPTHRHVQSGMARPIMALATTVRSTGCRRSPQRLHRAAEIRSCADRHILAMPGADDWLSQRSALERPVDL